MKHCFMGSYIYIIKLKIKYWFIQHIIVHHSMTEVIFKMCFNQVSVIQNFFFFLNLALLLYILMFLSFTSKEENILFLQTYSKKQIIYYFGKILSSGYPLWFHTKCLFIVSVGLLKNNDVQIYVTCVQYSDSQFLKDILHL